MCKKESPHPQRQVISGKSSYEQDKRMDIQHNSLYIHSLFGTQQCSGIALKQTTLLSLKLRYHNVYQFVNNKYLIVRKEQPLPRVYRKCSYGSIFKINIRFHFKTT